jgi:hypothetical protein
MLASYVSHRPPWDVAGVDYAVGIAPGTILDDPTTAKLPSGCSFSGTLVSCSTGDIIVSGYDFSLHGGIRLVTNSATNVYITNNKFSLSPNCTDPVIDARGTTSTLTIMNNVFNGGGTTCSSLNYGTIINFINPNGANFIGEYNLFLSTPQDAVDARGPSSGSSTYTLKYNVFYLQGFHGHPDGTQFNGGNFNGITISFNTYYNTSPPNTVAGTQPFHVESQLTASLTNSVVAYNTMVTPGTCQGGRNWPNGCTINFDIACKQDPQWVDSTINFSAFANYIDWSGAIAALSNAYSCPSTSWGKPTPNIDMLTGATLTP